MAKTPAHRPPMGWNSWDCYGTTVTEAEVLANAEFMATHLREFGWDTVVVDIDWSDPSARSHGYNDGAPLEIDEYGRLMPDPVRFPSSRGGRGFGPLADADPCARAEVRHPRDARHPAAAPSSARCRCSARRRPPPRSPTARTSASGTPTCSAWTTTHPAAQAYYDSTLALYAEWGVDFIKADDMLWPYQARDIEAYARAIAAIGPATSPSACPPGATCPSRASTTCAPTRRCGGSATTSGTTGRMSRRTSRGSRGGRRSPDRHGWPDGDMLPLGRLGIRAERGEPRDDGLTPAERVTLMTLWVDRALAADDRRRPADLPTRRPSRCSRTPTCSRVHATATATRELFREGGLVLWGADGPDGRDVGRRVQPRRRRARRSHSTRRTSGSRFPAAIARRASSSSGAGRGAGPPGRASRATRLGASRRAVSRSTRARAARSGAAAVRPRRVRRRSHRRAEANLVHDAPAEVAQREHELVDVAAPSIHVAASSAAGSGTGPPETSWPYGNSVGGRQPRRLVGVPRDDDLGPPARRARRATRRGSCG